MKGRGAHTTRPGQKHCSSMKPPPERIGVSKGRLERGYPLVEQQSDNRDFETTDDVTRENVHHQSCSAIFS